MSIVWGRYNFHSFSGAPVNLQQFNSVFGHISVGNKGIFKSDIIELVNLLQFNTPESLKEIVPYTDNQYGLTIIADCRIDNRLDLFNQFGLRRSDMPDSQIILQSYIRHGEDCVKHLLGAFVFAIWDEQNKKLFIARDHIGVRPIYYYQDKKCFVFASEKKGILMLPGINKELNEDYLIGQLTAQSVHHSNTFYKHIYRLLPAHSISIIGDKVNMKQYWDLDTNKEIHLKNTEEYVELFKEKLTEAVKCRLRTQKEVGVELSGGLDSSGVAVVAHKCLQNEGKELSTFSLSLSEEDRNLKGHLDGYDLIEEICALSGIKKRYYFTEPHCNDFIQSLDNSLKYFDGIVEHSDLIQLPMQLKAHELKINVMLSGFPGDELVTSFCRPAFTAYLDDNKCSKFLRNGIKQYPLKKLLSFAGYHYLGRINQRLARKIAMVLRSTKVSPSQKERIQIATFIKETHLGENSNVEIGRFRKNIAAMPLTFREYQKNHILRPNTSLRMESGNLRSNLAGSEMRYPLSDVRLLEFVLALPIDQKINEDYSRLLFRRSMNGLLPERLVWQSGKSPIPSYPAIFLNFEKIFYHQIEGYLESIKTKENLQFMDIDKLISLNHLNLSRLDWPIDTYAAADRHPMMFLIARYADLHPEFSLESLK